MTLYSPLDLLSNKLYLFHNKGVLFIIYDHGLYHLSRSSLAHFSFILFLYFRVWICDNRHNQILYTFWCTVSAFGRFFPSLSSNRRNNKSNNNNLKWLANSRKRVTSDNTKKVYRRTLSTDSSCCRKEYNQNKYFTRKICRKDRQNESFTINSLKSLDFTTDSKWA